MLYPENAAEKLSKELFKNPTAEYRGIPFWSWNCRVTRELIEEQLLIFKEMGFGGVVIHPRSGLEILYLGKEYMELTEYAVQRCKELGLVCWLYDEDGFPSGSAGGNVTKSIRFRGRFLLLTRHKYTMEDGFYPDRESFEEAAAYGEKPKGYYAAAYAVKLEKGCLSDYRRLYTVEEQETAEKNGENIWLAYVKLMEEESWFENQTYVDTMNPEATDEFIRITHESYYRWVGKEFGKTVPAIFTDEPRLGKHEQMKFAMSGDELTMPYTEHFAREMLEQYGKDPLDIVPEYVWELSEERFSENRYIYRNAAAECFVTSFLDRLGTWCSAHDIAMTGHVLSEETLGSQTYALGDCMRCYRSMDIPGIDILADRREYATVKQAVSVARQDGREAVVSELYGVTHWDCDFKTYKLQGDWQAALGVNIRVPHLSHMSLGGEAKRDWPGSIFFQAPWYKEYPYIEDYFSRLNTVLTRGVPCVNIGVVHPVESFWMYMGPNDQTAGKRRELDRAYAELIRWLLFGGLDFDFLSEALMPKQCEVFMKNGGDRLRAGRMSYSAVLVPNMVTIRSTTLDILEKFKEEGGRLIFMGCIPKLVDGRASDRAERLAAGCICIGRDRESLYAALKKERYLELYLDSGYPADKLLYQLRRDNTCSWLFICHGEADGQSGSEGEKYIVKLKGQYSVKRYDCQTGEILQESVRQDRENTYIDCHLYAEESVLFQLTEGKAYKTEAEKAKAEEQFRTVRVLREAVGCRREKNVLLLDYAGCRLDDGKREERQEILQLDNRLRQQLGFVLRNGTMIQPYHLSEGKTHKVTLYYQLEAEEKMPAFLALEEPEKCRIRLNGEEADGRVLEWFVDKSISVIALPDLRKGKNELCLQVSYNQKTKLENLYVLGDFDVNLRGTRAVLALPSDRLTIGDITRQGMPFYTGNLEYHFRLFVEEAGEYYVHIPHFKAPLLGVSVDKGGFEVIAYAPHRAYLGRLNEGEHELTICLYGSRFNSFGTLHNANDNYIWYGPDSYRTTGDDWTDDYRLRPAGLMSAVELQRKIFDF